ncbi:MAG: Txe/YoeB family addiction module toxin [Bacteroidales bacterium]|nr:Txe/YoeB family addiction module toxin [Bacteroidales bacterium]
MRSIVFEGNTWQVYEDLRIKNKILHKNLCKILKEMQRNDPAKGTGKPEQLKYELSSFWSRKLSQYDRLIYRFDDSAIHIIAIGGHYEGL